FRKLYLGYVGAGFLVIGAVSIGGLRPAVRRYLIAWIGLGLAWITAVTGQLAEVHEYYSLPLIAALAIVAAVGFDRVWSSAPAMRIVAIGLLAVAPVQAVR